MAFDVVIGLCGERAAGFISQRLLPPLNHSYLTNLKNVWPVLQDPWYDLGSRYTIPYVVWLDGILWRNDKIREDIAGMKVPWDIFWESQALARQGRHPRRRPRLACRCPCSATPCARACAPT